MSSKPWCEYSITHSGGTSGLQYRNKLVDTYNEFKLGSLRATYRKFGSNHHSGAWITTLTRTRFLTTNEKKSRRKNTHTKKTTKLLLFLGA
jgi:hypothetical protein